VPVVVMALKQNRVSGRGKRLMRGEK